MASVVHESQLGKVQGLCQAAKERLRCHLPRKELQPLNPGDARDYFQKWSCVLYILPTRDKIANKVGSHRRGENQACPPLRAFSTKKVNSRGGSG